ncbi:hypothetical protein CBA19CS22_39775 [Caballeronia novacaledonica]|uniref:Uncharacterized protein n=1 Tax=Caballeronia novacaledonica TaxID=1544861 RepID=A0ACB5R6U6_9BURK|nr:hypothetical protein CBA19CS22_39775 [Caballeronia novacaledonica]
MEDRIERPRKSKSHAARRETSEHAGNTSSALAQAVMAFLTCASTKRLVETYFAAFAVPCRLMGFNIAATGAAVTRGTS